MTWHWWGICWVWLIFRFQGSHQTLGWTQHPCEVTATDDPEPHLRWAAAGPEIRISFTIEFSDWIGIDIPSGKLTVCELENHHAINGKIHYFDWATFNSFLYVYQRAPIKTVFLMLNADSYFSKKWQNMDYQPSPTNRGGLWAIVFQRSWQGRAVCLRGMATNKNWDEMEAKCWAQLTNSATWVKEMLHVSKIIPKIYKTCIEFSISAQEDISGVGWYTPKCEFHIAGKCRFVGNYGILNQMIPAWLSAREFIGGFNQGFTIHWGESVKTGYQFQWMIIIFLN